MAALEVCYLHICAWRSQKLTVCILVADMVKAGLRIIGFLDKHDYRGTCAHCLREPEIGQKPWICPESLFTLACDDEHANRKWLICTLRCNEDAMYFGIRVSLDWGVACFHYLKSNLSFPLFTNLKPIAPLRN